MRITYTGSSVTGRVKKRNEDSMYYPGDALENIVVVADGMGGYNAGDVASSMAVRVTLNIVENCRAQNQSEETAVLRAINEANRSILEYARSNEFCDGMGTTLIAALFKDNRVTLGHVGDSRAYLFTAGGLKRVTRDHSFVQALMDKGSITPEEARVHPYRNVILRAVGTEEQLDVDIYREDFNPGDKLLVCSDGLTRYLDDEEIEALLAGKSPGAAVERMVKAALKRGGADNVTVVVATCEEA